MNPFTGTALYLMIWWTVLFAVLPFGTKPVADPDKATGWRGVPERPMLWRKVLVTTVISTLLWLGAWWLITSPYLSFRSGFLAMPSN
jgi:predicted secreted protein